jgi:hypothetical protein
MYGNISSESYKKEVLENQLSSSISPGIYKNAKLVSLLYTDENISKAVFTFKLEEGTKGTTDIVEDEKSAEKITRAFLHILDAFSADTDVLKSSISSFADLVSKVEKAINKENLVDFKIKGYTYSSGTKYGQGFPLSGQNNKTGGWIPNSFIYPAGVTTIKFNDYELKNNAEYEALKNKPKETATENDLDLIAKNASDLDSIFSADNSNVPF